ncbi:MAG: tetratricopeptide repeat protein [Deltaproteobacteria bacterium]|nr:MAG: tetratricopeptide repeat protein [Deltaproteobacteria bacterium]
MRWTSPPPPWTRLARCALCAVCVAAAVPYARPARARADWSVRRDGFDRRLVARYKALLASDPNDRRALRKLMSIYRKYRSLAALVGEYEAAFARHRRFSDAVVLGHLYLERGDGDRALSMYEAAAELEPADADVQLALADLYRQLGRADDARAAYDRALAAAGDRGSRTRKTALRALVDLALAADDIAAARGYFDQLIALEPQNARLRIDLADALARHGMHREAIAALDAAEQRLRDDPQGRIDVIARIGAEREALGDEDGAIREYRRALALMRRDYHMRRELIDRIVDIHRRRQDLPALVGQLEREWPPRRRRHMEWDVLARLYEELGDQEKAIAAYRAAVARAPYELDTQRRLIALLENAGREDEAIAQYERVVKVAPGEPRFQLELARRYWRRGKADRAIALLDKLERRFPGDAGVQMALADLYAKWGKDDRALAVYVRLTKIEPDEVEHLVNLGEQYFQRGDKAQAVAVWRKIAARRTADGYARLAEVYAEHDMLADAVKTYDKAIKADPQNPARYRGRARVYERLKQLANAVADWQRALELTGDKPSDRPARREARERIVALLHAMGGRALADKMADWQRAFTGTPPDIEAGYFLVEAFRKRRTKTDRALARDILERILALAPEDREALQMLGKIYRDDGDYQRAIELLERLAALSPGREREFYSEIAELKVLLQQDEDAIRYSELALEKSPNDPAAHEQLAKTYEKMQQFDKASAAYAKTIELDPRNFRVYFRLATLYIRQGKHAEAAQLYRGVLRRATDEQILRRAGRKAIDLEEYMGTLGELERIVAPLAFTFAHKPVYREILVDLYARYVPRLVAQTRGGDAQRAAAAADELARLGQHGLKPLLEALSDEDRPEQQRIAVSVLGHLGNRGAALPLVRLASAARAEPPARSRLLGTYRPTLDWDVRVEALVAAGRLGEPRIVPELIELSRHRDSAMRAAAVFALGRTRARAAAPALAAALDSREPAVAVLACLGLGQLGDRRYRVALERVVADASAHRHTRAACALALGALGDRAALPALIAALDDGDERLQRMASWALGRLGDRAAVPALMAAYFGKSEPVREAVAWAIARAATGHVDRTPVAALADYPTSGGRYDAAAALEALVADLDAAPPPAALIADHVDAVARGLRAALASAHTNRVLRALADLTQRDDGLSLGALTAAIDAAPPAVRRRVAAAIDRVAADITPDLLRLAREHRDPDVRAAAIAALARTRGPGAAAAVEAALSDPRASVRVAAMAAAARLAAAGGPRASALALAVAERARTAPSWEERRAAAEQLGRSGAAAPTDALIAALRDRVGFVREAAARSLGALGRRDATDALLAATRDEFAGVRRAAAAALVAIGSPRAEARLRELAESDPDPGVRAAAGGARR